MLKHLLNTAFPLALLYATAVVLVLFFGARFAPIALILHAFLGAIWLLTAGEYMPGQNDNPDGKETHPFAQLAALALSFAVIVAVMVFQSRAPVS
jgi:heme O synthase-like polyprenyltransferase